MPLSANDLITLDALLGGADAEVGALAQLRQQLPGLSLTRCDASDIDHEQPFRIYPRFRVYLVDSSDHCWTITGNPAQATGLVVANQAAATSQAT